MKKHVMLAAASLCAITAFAAEQTIDPKFADLPAAVQKVAVLHPNLVERIHAVGSVCVEGKKCPVKVPKVAAASADGKPRGGEDVYTAVCSACHDGGLLGSPKLGDKAAWSARLGQGKDTLYKHALEGLNAMPAKGGAEIPDEEVKNAVDYMVASVK